MPTTTLHAATSTPTASAHPGWAVVQSGGREEQDTPGGRTDSSAGMTGASVMYSRPSGCTRKVCTRAKIAGLRSAAVIVAASKWNRWSVPTSTSFLMRLFYGTRVGTIAPTEARHRQASAATAAGARRKRGARQQNNAFVFGPPHPPPPPPGSHLTETHCKGRRNLVIVSSFH